MLFSSPGFLTQTRSDLTSTTHEIIKSKVWSVRLVASDRRVAKCGTILVLRFVSSLLVFVSSLQIVESPNVGQYWFCVSSRRFRSLSRRIGSVPMRLGSSRRSRIGSRPSLLFAVSFFWVSTYRRFSFILLALFFIFSYAFLSLSFHISWVHFSSCPVFRQFISNHRVAVIHIIVSPSFTWDSGNIFPPVFFNPGCSLIKIGR